MSLTKLLAVLACAIGSTLAMGSTTVPCKYSVRDVAFVNVHGKSWQLQLVKPDGIDPEKFSQWNESLQAKLDRSNVGYTWLEPDSEDAKRLRADSSPRSALPPMALVGREDASIPVSSESKLTFGETLDAILDSPAREEILSEVVDALCVFVFVESGNEKIDVPAAATVNAAIERINQQMWTLEKPSDQGPSLVTISNSEKAGEDWLLRSLGFGESHLPCVAIVYGQGRRLGEVISGDDINLQQLVGRASLCGQDCECDLDRDWLYGAQMIHVWSNQRERAAESSLSFDPKSAFVIAEVAQIIQKNSGQNSGQPRIDLGGGLIIHDLDEIPTTKKPAQPSLNELSNDGTLNGHVGNPEDTHPSSEEPSTLVDAPPVDAPPGNVRGISVPWTLLVALAVVTFFVLVLKLIR